MEVSLYPVCHLTETSPESIFNQKYFITNELRNGRIYLLGNTLTTVTGTDVWTEEIKENELADKIEEYFQLNI